MEKTTNRINPGPLFRYLESRGIQQTWLAEQLDCSTQYLTNIKSGHKPVPQWMPEKVAAVLAIPAFMLFDGLPDVADGASKVEATS